MPGHRLTSDDRALYLLSLFFYQLSIGAGRPPSRTGGSMLSCDVSDKKLRWLKSIRRIRTFVATYAPPFVLFMAPALINGFPLMFEGDSGGYLAHGILRDHAHVRPISIEES